MVEAHVYPAGNGHLNFRSLLVQLEKAHELEVAQLRSEIAARHGAGEASFAFTDVGIEAAAISPELLAASELKPPLPANGSDRDPAAYPSLGTLGSEEVLLQVPDAKAAPCPGPRWDVNVNGKQFSEPPHASPGARQPSPEGGSGNEFLGARLEGLSTPRRPSVDASSTDMAPSERQSRARPSSSCYVGVQKTPSGFGVPMESGVSISRAPSMLSVGGAPGAPHRRRTRGTVARVVKASDTDPRQLFTLRKVWEANGRHAATGGLKKVFTQRLHISEQHKGSSGSSTLKSVELQPHMPHFSWRERKLILNPGSKRRVTWDALGIFALMIDIIWIPMQVFDIKPGTLTDVLMWFPMMYWTLDLPSNFLVGFYTPQGNLIMRPRAIALRYLKGWFGLDVAMVTNDWVSLILLVYTESEGGTGQDSLGLARLAKVARLGRILRTLRLLRLMKLRELLFLLNEVIDSENLMLCYGMLQNVVLLVALNHFVACMWYMVGTSGTERNWIEWYGFQDAGADAQYFVSLHWSLTQFTPAAMEVYPQNAQERIFTVVVILFAMVIFSSFVSSIASAMTRLRTLKANKVTQQYMLRKFLRENRISRDLSAKITRYLGLAWEVHRRSTDASKVELLSLLSGPLRFELQKELYLPYLQTHEFFIEYQALGEGAICQLCHGAIEKHYFSKGDMIFSVGDEAHKMYFLATGSLGYLAARALVKGEKGAVDDDGCGKEFGRNVVALQAPACISEAVLWTPWVHRGSMMSVVESVVATLDAQKFAEISASYPEVFHLCQKKAQSYLDGIVKTIVEDHGEVFDVAPELMNARLKTGRGDENDPDNQARCELEQAEALEAQLQQSVLEAVEEAAEEAAEAKEAEAREDSEGSNDDSR